MNDEYQLLRDTSRARLGLSLQILPPGPLPPERIKPFFDLLDRTLTTELERTIGQEFWIDTLGRSRHVEIQVQMDDAVLRFLARRSQTYASNSHIFLLWMVGTSLVLLTVAILFLRNQIRPVQNLAQAAEAFGKGRNVPDDVQVRGAREVRQAAVAFNEMRDRIEKHMEQRTTMLAGVSHDLRTILTRFRLNLAMIGDDPDTMAMQKDVAEMQAMLQDYMDFAKGDAGEVVVPHRVHEILAEVVADIRNGPEGGELTSIGLEMHSTKDIVVPLRRHAFKRIVSNLAHNAARYADNVELRARKDRKWLRVFVDDDGPGIPASAREEVFRPFYRLDPARNQNKGNTGLGLSIARDIARTHGGDVSLDDSPLGGLRAMIKIPV